MIPFGTKSVTLSMFIDLLTSTCRSTQVKIASTDLWPQEMITFSEMLALVESESSFGAYVCHRRPGGSRATSDLVKDFILHSHDWKFTNFWSVSKRKVSDLYRFCPLYQHLRCTGVRVMASDILSQTVLATLSCVYLENNIWTSKMVLRTFSSWW